MVLLYSCLCVVLYAHMDASGSTGQLTFTNLRDAFISIYSLSLTVNDPDIYLVREGAAPSRAVSGSLDLKSGVMNCSAPPAASEASCVLYLHVTALLPEQLLEHHSVRVVHGHHVLHDPQHHPGSHLPDLLRKAQGDGDQEVHTRKHKIHPNNIVQVNRRPVERLIGRQLDLESTSVSRIRRADDTAVLWQGLPLMQ